MEKPNLEKALDELKSYPEELGLDLRKKKDRFKWFLASLLFAKRISAEIAKKTFLEFVKEGLTTPKKLMEAGWNKLVDVLDSDGYVRYDFSTATNILKTIEALAREYNGDVDELHERSVDSKDLERKLMKFKGFGPVASNIFLRELRGIWSKADPEPSKMAVKVAEKLGLENLVEVKRYESKLVKINLEYCKKRRCRKCPVKNYCYKGGMCK